MSYSWGDVKVVKAWYEPIALSDHMAYIINFSLPPQAAKMLSPRSRPQFKTRPEVICDSVFQEHLSDSMADWQEVRDLGLEVLQWWELLVKPGIRKLALKRSKQINREKKGELNFCFSAKLTSPGSCRMVILVPLVNSDLSSCRLSQRRSCSSPDQMRSL